MAEGDLQTARIGLAGGAPGRSVAVLIQQAVERYLKGYLIYRGWELQKTHDLRALIDDACDYDPSFAEFLELARVLTGAYLQERYPPVRALSLSNQEAGNVLQQAEKLILKIKDSFGPT